MSYKINKFTKNFIFEEFFVSKSYPQEAKNLMGIVSDQEAENLFTLSSYILQPVRDIINIPLRITSGFRDFKLNSLIGGSPNSLHMSGRASDYTTWYDRDRTKLWDAFNYTRDNLAFSELIIYTDGNDIPIFIHVATAIWHEEPLVKINKETII